MTEPTAAKTGQLPITLATWIYLLHDRGHIASDEAIAAACASVAEAAPQEVDARGAALAAAVEHALDGATAPDSIARFLQSLYGFVHISDRFEGSTREDRLHAARASAFRTGMPWVAIIYDRFPNGSVGPHWVMVERITDVVTCMDPYPWDDLDEEYAIPVPDFLVKWELADFACVRWVP